MFRKYEKILIFDTETSALSPLDGEILEFGGIVLKKKDKKFEIEDKIDVLIKNEHPITNSFIHHITEEMCSKEGITKKDLYSLLRKYFGETKDILLVAYNLPFDMKFIKSFMESINPDYVVKNPTLDVLEIAKDRTGLRKGNKLCDMIIRYSVEDVENSHRALDDCEALLAVMRKMWEEKSDLEDYVKERA